MTNTELFPMGVLHRSLLIISCPIWDWHWLRTSDVILFISGGCSCTSSHVNVACSKTSNQETTSLLTTVDLSLRRSHLKDDEKGTFPWCTTLLSSYRDRYFKVGKHETGKRIIDVEVIEFEMFPRIYIKKIILPTQVTPSPEYPV